MPSSKKFIEFAKEKLVVLIAHNELGHDSVEEKDYDGKKRRACPLYPGMTCREHLDASVDIDVARGEGLVKIPFIELCPNSWLVPPVGKPEQIPEEDQFTVKKVQARIETMQEASGPSLTRAQYRYDSGDVAMMTPLLPMHDYREIEVFLGVSK